MLKVILSMLLFIDCVFLAKGLRDNKDITITTVIGAILVGAFVYFTIG
jgi:hypothetical protein